MRFQQWSQTETRRNVLGDTYTSSNSPSRRMTWPDAVAYQEAIQTPSVSLVDPQFQTAQVTLDRRGLPVAYAGRFAVVFKLKTDTDETWALRCFTTPGDDLSERTARYRLIQKYVDEHRNIFVPFRYIERGIKVGPHHYPVLAMRWASGEPLGRWVENNRDNPTALRTLAGTLTSLLLRLESAQIAHGDWQHDNLLIADDGKRVTLVDYDAMFVPEFEGRQSEELGHPNYQHPARTSEHFGVGLDRFSCLVIQTSLLGIARDPGLWERYSDGESLLFKKSDFLNTADSSVFSELRALAELDNDELLADAIARLEDACRAGAMSTLLPEVSTSVEFSVPAYEPIKNRTIHWLNETDTEAIEGMAVRDTPNVSKNGTTGKQWWAMPEVTRPVTQMSGRVAGLQTVAVLPQDAFTYIDRVHSQETQTTEDNHILSWRVGIALFAALVTSLVVARTSGMTFFLIGPFFALLVNLGSLGYTKWPRRVIFDELTTEIEKMEKLIEERRKKIVQKGGVLSSNTMPPVRSLPEYVTTKLHRTSINQVLTVPGVRVSTLRLLKEAGIDNALELQRRAALPRVPVHQWTALQNWCRELETDAAQEFRRNGGGSRSAPAEVVRLRHEVAEFERHVAHLKREREQFPDVTFSTYLRRLCGLDTAPPKTNP